MTNASEIFSFNDLKNTNHFGVYDIYKLKQYYIRDLENCFFLLLFFIFLTFYIFFIYVKSRTNRIFN